MLWAIAFGAAVLVVIATSKYGIGLEADSVTYIQVAREIRAGQGISPAFTLQPPLYPMLLAVGSALTFSDPLDFAVWLHALLFGALVWMSGAMLLRELPHAPMLALLGALGVASARPLLNVAFVAFSELAFIFLTLATLVALTLFLETERARWFGLAMAAAALAWLARYIGVALLVTGALALLWLWRAAWRKKIYYAGAFGLAGGLPLALWALRNVVVAGEPFGARAASRFTLEDNLRVTAQTFANWFAPNEWSWVVYGALGLCVGVFIVQMIRGAKNVPLERSRFFYVCALFCAVFVFMLVITATTTAYNRIGTRLLAPLFVPAWLLFVLILGRMVERQVSDARKKLVAALTLALLALFLIFPLQTLWARVERSLTQGAGGFNTTAWRASDTIRHVQTHRASFAPLLVSNSPDALYILADVRAQNLLPKFQHASQERAFDAETLRGAYPPEPVTLIWFDRAERNPFVFTLDEVREFTDVNLIQQLSDGAVYRMEKKSR